MLRNKYLHSQPNLNLDPSIYKQDYIFMLRLFVIAVIKINDDFCLYEEAAFAQENE